jgi:hypothetical protein
MSGKIRRVRSATRIGEIGIHAKFLWESQKKRDN